MGKTINFNVPFLGLNKQPVTNPDQSAQTLGFHLASVLSSITQGDPFLWMAWAETVFNNQPLEVNDSEWTILKDIVTNCPLPAILRVQILGVIEK